LYLSPPLSFSRSLFESTTISTFFFLKIKGSLAGPLREGVVTALNDRLGEYSKFHFEAKAARLDYLRKDYYYDQNVRQEIRGTTQRRRQPFLDHEAHATLSASHLVDGSSSGSGTEGAREGSGGREEEEEDDPPAPASVNPDEIIGIIPYYGEGMGLGQAQSSLSTRKAYLEATYWSVRALTSRVVVAVCTDADALFVEDLVRLRFAPALAKRRRRLLEEDAKTKAKAVPSSPPPSSASYSKGFGGDRGGDDDEWTDSSGPSLEEAGPVLTLLRVYLQGPQSLPVSAVSFLVRTVNKEEGPKHKWSYEPLPRPSSSSSSSSSHSASSSSSSLVVDSWPRHLKEAYPPLFSPSKTVATTITETTTEATAAATTTTTYGGVSVWANAKFVMYTEADQIVHARAMRRLLPLLTDTHFVAPHRMIPMPQELDFSNVPTVKRALATLRKEPKHDARPVGDDGFSRLTDMLKVNKDVKETVAVTVYAERPRRTRQDEGEEKNDDDDDHYATVAPGAPGGGGAVGRCCMDRGNCTKREHWISYLEPAVKLMRVAPSLGPGGGGGSAGGDVRGLSFVAGEGNVQHSPPSIRACAPEMGTPEGPGLCP
jgi:hypothetical protein